MKLTTDQQARLLATHAICANEACDACTKVLGWLRFTRKDQPGDWCSRECRDGIQAAARYVASRKTASGRCWQCGLVLPERDQRKDAKYCDATCKRNASFAKSGGRTFQLAA